MEADLGINQSWLADTEESHGHLVAVEEYQQTLKNTLQDCNEDVKDTIGSGLSCWPNYLQSTGNSSNNSSATARMAYTHKEHAVRNIELVNANAGLQSELDDECSWLAAMLNQVTLLQSQLAVHLRKQQWGLAFSDPSLDAVDAPTKSNDDAPMDLQGGG
jgi:hypothetical protein